MNVRGRDMGSFVTEARAKVEAEAPLKEGITIEWGGEFENKERAMKRLLMVVPVALLLTLLLLFKAFDSLPLAVVTLLNVPFALMGGVLGAWAQLAERLTPVRVQPDSEEDRDDDDDDLAASA